MERKNDKLDIFILKSLQEDCSRPHKQIAGEFNVSTTTVSDRIQGLIKRNYLNGFVAVLNRNKLQQMILAYIYLRLRIYSEKSVEVFKQDIMQIKEVCECYRITGRHHIRLKIVTTDPIAFSKIEIAIGGLKDVMDLQSYFVNQEIMTDKGFDF